MIGPVFTLIGLTNSPNIEQLRLGFGIAESTMPLGILGSQVNVYVTFSQTGSTPMRIWAEQCSWGYECLSFELKATKDSPLLTVKKLPRVWEKNYPQWLTLTEGRHFVRPVAFGDGRWAPFPVAKDQVGKFWVRAVFFSPRDSFSDEHKVWTGPAESEWELVEFRNHMG